eukprot:NODE_452_length_7258_cov_0.721050.p5 type:complete len:218 gc:universal NODE_452_length_7258_cov_0.721050:5577-6230(+)
MTTNDFYEKASLYWSKVEANDDGMLGGLSHVSDIDIKASKQFLLDLKPKFNFTNQICLDCGAGIGRVTKHLLSKQFNTIDLVESNEKFLYHAKSVNLKGLNISEYFCSSLHVFQFTKKYDCIWIQWVSSQLFNEDFISFLQKCQNALSQDGIIIVKENILRNGGEEDIVMDDVDYSFTRTDAGFKKLFERANLVLIHEEIQQNWPQHLFPVKMYCLK